MKTFKQLFREETSASMITLYHGGRGLEFSYRESINHKKGQWEHGPGLYLTTHFETAYKYAKGGGKIYKVTIERGNDIKDVEIPFVTVTQFVKDYVIGSKRKELLEDIQSNMVRMGQTNSVDAQVFLNLIINLDAIQHSKTAVLKDFLVRQGVDYSVVGGYGGRGETVVVVMNPKVIKKVVAYRASDIDTKDYEIPFSFQ